MVTVTFVDVYGDWQGIYVDGEMYYQNHSVKESTFLEIMEEYDVDEVQTIYGYTVEGNLPKNVEDLDHEE